ncbi:MAG: hypothetical protein HYZ53_02665 [Planctomycetes bacterium]|nr:hypothetical protein [Planctomycetota bacterium]
MRYLLISGQASVLYGGATFSENVDLWVAPSRDNFAGLARALRHAEARIHKLTPPLTTRYARGGHGFHFVLPPDAVGPAYLDVMGRPPRVGSFSRVARRANRMPTAWGELPVVAIPDLVELKKTRRPADYDVITNLVRIRLAEAGPRCGTALLRWGMARCFRLDVAVWILTAFPHAPRAAIGAGPEWPRTLLSKWTPGEEVPTEAGLAVQAQLAAEQGRQQQADIRYWSRILQELRELRRAGALLPEGRPL